MYNKKYLTKIAVGLAICAKLVVIGLISNSTSANADESISDNVSAYDLIIDGFICRGNENTDCSFITNKYFQQIGDKVDPGEIADARLRLGTLLQFKNIRISLEKSSLRKHVNVVFEVEEANHIQYNISTNFAPSNFRHQNHNSSSISTGITDFNFLGSGKQLQLNVTAGYSKYNTSDSYISPELKLTTFQSESNTEFLSSDLSYYDPHLFDSKRFYLNSLISFTRSFQRYNYQTNIDGAIFNSDDKHTADHYNYNISFGSRFASSSFIEFKVDDSKYVKKPVTSISYGWDSRDDLVFPTKGSSFRSTLRGLNTPYERELNIHFESHHQISNDLIFSYSIDEQVIYIDYQLISSYKQPDTTLTISDIDSSDGKRGKYTGWKYELTTRINSPGPTPLTLGVYYIHQTDSLLMRFGFQYHTSSDQL